jgi:hypothetical protein
MILVPLLLFPAAWALPLFAGITLASQVFQSNGFTGTLPFYSFLMLVAGLVIAFALLFTGLPVMAKVIGEKISSHSPAQVAE